MARRFGRNQRRQMREALSAATRARTDAENKALRIEGALQRAKSEHQDFLAQCRMVDERGGKIEIDVLAMVYEQERTIELRAELMTDYSGRLRYSHRIDPFSDLRRDRDNFVKVVAAHIADRFAATLVNMGIRSEW